MGYCHFARSSKQHEGAAICKSNTFMLSIDQVLEIKCLDLRPVISSSALWTGLVLL